MLVPKPASKCRAVQGHISIRQPGFGWPFPVGCCARWRQVLTKGADRLTDREADFTREETLKNREVFSTNRLA